MGATFTPEKNATPKAIIAKIEKNLPLETISEITGLSIKEIQDLNK